MYYVQNSHVGIISRELFHKTQEELARRMSREPNSTKTATTATGKYSRYALSNVMICAECGSRYKRVTWNIPRKKASCLALHQPLRLWKALLRNLAHGR